MIFQSFNVLLLAKSFQIKNLKPGRNVRFFLPPLFCHNAIDVVYLHLVEGIWMDMENRFKDVTYWGGKARVALDEFMKLYEAEQSRTKVGAFRIYKALEPAVKSRMKEASFTALLSSRNSGRRVAVEFADAVLNTYAMIPSFTQPLDLVEAVTLPPLANVMRIKMDPHIAREQLYGAINATGYAQKEVCKAFDWRYGFDDRWSDKVFSAIEDKIPRLRAALLYAFLSSAPIGNEVIEIEKEHVARGVARCPNKDLYDNHEYD